MHLCHRITANRPSTTCLSGCLDHQLPTLCVRAVPPEPLHGAHREDENACTGHGAVPGLRSGLRGTMLQPAPTRAGHSSQGARCYRPEVGGGVGTDIFPVLTLPSDSRDAGTQVARGEDSKHSLGVQAHLQGRDWEQRLQDCCRNS
ncbi:hypothetical protein HJG60_008631 [Phyllostomus discolor]|uniref:Uncharacterized protein n=1 Tax=Phyllostomus discolor TaxID=89673 RepID=A0A833YY21_9CHIR|nr:hypothetical protein HJG60_008631 [Phyllostomus discolor]